MVPACSKLGHDQRLPRCIETRCVLMLLSQETKLEDAQLLLKEDYLRSTKVIDL